LFNAKTNEIVEELKIRCLFLIQSNSILNKKLNNMKDNKKKIFLKNAEYECLSFYVNSMIEQQLPIDNELLAKIWKKIFKLHNKQINELKFRLKPNIKFNYDLNMLKEEVLQNVLQKHFKNNLVYEQNTKEKLNDIINKLEKHTRLDIKNYLSN